MFVRWENLEVGLEDERRLPNLGADAVVRTFDAPEALDIRFHEVRAKSALNRVPAKSRMPFRFTINPYRGCSHACVYCFARPTHKFLDLDAGRDFEREIVVKVNAPELARAELSRPSWKREQVALGTNTDPYQWVESRYKLMPGIWEALLDSDTPCSLVTKSPLALRDIDILAALAAGPGVSVYFSVPTLDEKVWRETEPHTPSPRARLDAVRTMNDAGVPCGILVAPVIPGVNDAPEQVGEILRIAHEHGAIGAPVMPLHLRGEVREIWFGWLRHYRPDLIDRYEELYRRGAYVPADERRRIQAVADSVRPRGAGNRRRPRPQAATARGRERAAAPALTQPAQDSLF